MGNPIFTRHSATGSCRLGAPRQSVRGFTLVELVMVILLLGIMATFSSQFIGIGSQIYGDASSREQLMSDARFAMERLNREVRDAVPGSVRIETATGDWVDSGSCLRFWPISATSRYLTLNRAVSGSAGTLELLMQTPASAANPLQDDDSAVAANRDLLVVFPIPRGDVDSLTQGCVYGNCVARVNAVQAPVSGVQAVHYAASEQLDGLSPANRVYFARQQVRYCVEGSRLFRSSGPIGEELSSPSLMAEWIRSGTFYREPAAFNASGEFGVRFVFERKGESVTFNHKIGVSNVP
ncbi:type II secretion system protein [Aeromonas enteropelogenes]|uniref:prepilin-type N-terminal cleavage/methylation domain-containing protein n=1 Tax=Aeromonas enteropelogenes TaxID=29489 RepID=UPI0022B2736B|nr:type II secretion system protein [Aeromonas enteropelogenes]